MNDTQYKSEFLQAFRQGQKTLSISEIDFGHTKIPISITPIDMKITDLTNILEPHLNRPTHFKQDVIFTSIDDFCDYVNRYKTDQTTIFYTETGRVFAHLDWHTSKEQPSFLRHNASFDIDKTPNWRNWIEKNNKPMNQEEFALFIEDRINDFKTPSGDFMLEMASTLKASIDVKFHSQKIISNGQTKLTWDEDINGRAGHQGEMAIPREFTIQIVPLKNSQTAYEISAWFRYRISKEKGLTLWYTLKNHQKSFDDAIQDKIAHMKSKITGVHIYNGEAIAN